METTPDCHSSAGSACKARPQLVPLSIGCHRYALPGDRDSLTTAVGARVRATPVSAEAYRSKPSSTLTAGDEIRVTFSGAPELNVKQKIQSNGRVSLPTIGDVSASGKSITSFQSELTSLYAPHLQDPTVIVSLEVRRRRGLFVRGGSELRARFPWSAR